MNARPDPLLFGLMHDGAATESGGGTTTPSQTP